MIAPAGGRRVVGCPRAARIRDARRHGLLASVLDSRLAAGLADECLGLARIRTHAERWY
jgi:hypothetical protein